MRMRPLVGAVDQALAGRGTACAAGPWSSRSRGERTRWPFSTLSSRSGSGAASNSWPPTWTTACDPSPRTMRGSARSCASGSACPSGWGIPTFAREPCANVGGTEDAARRERYLFLRRVARETGADAIATAHNRDDQAETLLLRLLRGSGRVGLGAMRARTRGHRPAPARVLAPGGSRPSRRAGPPLARGRYQCRPPVPPQSGAPRAAAVPGSAGSTRGSRRPSPARQRSWPTRPAFSSDERAASSRVRGGRTATRCS